MKKLIMVIVITACLILCAAMWPQNMPAKEAAAAPTLTPDVTVAQPEDLGTKEIEELIASEKEKIEALSLEVPPNIISEPDPTTDPAPVTPGAQAIDDPTPEEMPMVSEAQPAPEPQLTPAPAPSQIVTDPQPGDMVYVPGFGWLECQGPGEVIHDTEIHENGNKIGIMG